MFHSVAVYTKGMQALYLKYFKDRHLELNTDHRDVDFYCKHLQRYDVQLKMAERLPESQRLGMFLIDLTPYKEYVRQCSVDSLQQLQLELNADVVHRTRLLIEKLNDLHTTLESHPTTLVPLFKRLTALDSYNQILQNVENSDISQIGALYSVIDRFDVPHTEVDRRAFESTHYLITSARHVAEACLPDREGVVDAIDKCLARDVRYLYVQVKRVVRPLVEAEVLLDGKSDHEEIWKQLVKTEDVVRTYVTMANFVREVQRYLGMPNTRFTELFNLSSRYVNTRNLWLLMADWDIKLEKWKNQSFQTLDIQEINSYTFKYMEACDKLERLLPKNTVISVFEEKRRGRGESLF
ncbi:unnamed protein product [Candidula unifasciata]|uniref:Uncharacterized protein n=1 Tax=Candidula unifasciata TaxID=100452 RepID=A0A8S3Z3B0_9EUPU|nr:unnamed protein product [Candidula unifasciata]